MIPEAIKIILLVEGLLGGGAAGGGLLLRELKERLLPQ